MDKIFISFLFCIGTTQVIYPIISQKPLQWLQYGNWIDCASKDIITPLNCNHNDSIYIECFEIPQNGLCSNIIKLNQTDRYYLKLELLTDQDVIVNVNVSKAFIRNILLNNQSKIEIFKLPQTLENSFNFNLSLRTNGKVFLSKGQVQSQSEQGCLSMNYSTLQCIKCDQQSYFMYQGLCLNQMYLKDLQKLNNGFSASYNITNNSIQSIFTNLDGVISDIMVPRISFLESLQNPIVIGYAKIDEVSFISKSQVKFEASLYDSLNHIPCTRYETPEFYVTEIVFSFTLTLFSVTQYQLMTNMRIIQQKLINNQIQIFQEQFSLPDQCCVNKTVNIFGKSQILNIQKNYSQYNFEIEQQVLNPNYASYSIEFEQAKLLWNDMEVYLYLNTTKRLNNSIQYNLTLPNIIDVHLANATILLKSKLIKPENRILEQTKSTYFENVKLMYVTEQQTDRMWNDHIHNTSEVSEQSKQQSDLMWIWITAGVFVFLFVLCLFIYILRKIRKKHLVSKEISPTFSNPYDSSSPEVLIYQSKTSEGINMDKMSPNQIKFNIVDPDYVIEQ